MTALLPRQFQSTPPARAETCCSCIQLLGLHHFNPLHPRGRRHKLNCTYLATFQFQSTPPARAETSSTVYHFLLSKFQSTPPARAETFEAFLRRSSGVISIHSTREGGDTIVVPFFPKLRYFNPLHPRGRRQRRHNPSINHIRISIHSTREGGDTGI